MVTVPLLRQTAMGSIRVVSLDNDVVRTRWLVTSFTALVYSLSLPLSYAARRDAAEDRCCKRSNSLATLERRAGWRTAMFCRASMAAG
jgi:hypothetical protein